MKKMGATLLLGAAFSVAAASATAGTLDEVKKRGTLKCGVSTGLTGFSNTDAQGKWKGLDVDICRAVAAAVLGDAEKVSYKPLTAKERFTAIQSGEVDLLSRNTTWTLTRDGSLGLNFAGVNYYDGQGFMARSDLGIKNAKELDGATVCLQAGTTTERNLGDYFREHGMKYQSITYDKADSVAKGFESGRCDVMTGDQSKLYSLRMHMKDPKSVTILPDVISKEPLGPVVRQGDDAWFNVVKWSLFAMINAEEMGVSSKNLGYVKAYNKNPGTARLLHGEGNKLGLNEDWAYQIIKQVGNYGEAFDRNVGQGSSLKIDRGLNALWNKGGLQYAPPIR